MKKSKPMKKPSMKHEEAENKMYKKLEKMNKSEMKGIKKKKGK